MAFDYANIVTTVWPTTTMNYNRYQIVQPIRIYCIVRLKTKKCITISFPANCYFTYSIKEPQLERKHNSMRHLDVSVVLLHVLEALEMQRQYHGQLLHSHPLLRLLVTTTIITFELVVTAKRLRVAEAPKAMRYTSVLVNVHL